MTHFLQADARDRTGAHVNTKRKLVILDKVCLYLMSLVADHALAQAISHCLSQCRPSLDPRPVHVGFLVGKVMLGQVLLQGLYCYRVIISVTVV